MFVSARFLRACKLSFICVAGCSSCSMLLTKSAKVNEYANCTCSGIVLNTHLLRCSALNSRQFQTSRVNSSRVMEKCSASRKLMSECTNMQLVSLSRSKSQVALTSCFLMRLAPSLSLKSACKQNQLKKEKCKLCKHSNTFGSASFRSYSTV